MNKDFWEKYYKDNKITEPSSFAVWAENFIRGPIVDLGCGDGRDVYYFKSKGRKVQGVDASNEAEDIIKSDVLDYINTHECPPDVYTRFFWHAITREEQLAILDWVTERIWIEARTTEDKPKNIIGAHDRNLVDVTQLKDDLKERGFSIHFEEEGTGLSPYKGEDPHLIRIVASR